MPRPTEFPELLLQVEKSTEKHGEHQAKRASPLASIPAALGLGSTLKNLNAFIVTHKLAFATMDFTALLAIIEANFAVEESQSSQMADPDYPDYAEKALPEFQSQNPKLHHCNFQ
uniref:Uncharacterized protein n=1 Tax=Ditylenchus dipsaci TaxID=166011 RepID=A0A915DPK7_9BILA